jgi:hypothetical protein
MHDAVAEYRAHEEGPERWALGRFVVPLARWSELRSCLTDAPTSAAPWPVSLVAAAVDFDRIENTREESRLVVQAVECKAANGDDVSAAARITSLGVELFVEPTDLAGFSALAPLIANAGVSAKIRTGGVTVDAFPSPKQVLDFLVACREAGIRFKATAGLHHAVRGEYRLTYEAAPPMGEMFGFLNVAVAAALVWHDRSAAAALAALEERSMDAFVFTDDGLAWRGERLSTAEIDDARSRFFTGFGSCSFHEPMAEIGLEAQPRP